MASLLPLSLFNEPADGRRWIARRHFTSEEYRAIRREMPSLSKSVTPIDSAILSFQFEQRAIVPCHCCS
jgi:hypothetical protein